MAESTKKTKTKKSHASKVVSTPEEIIFGEEVPKATTEKDVEEISEENLPEVEENLTEVTEVEENLPKVEENLIENSEDSRTESPGDIAAEGAQLYKLRSDLPDDKSKWAVQIKTGPKSYHRIFEGSLIRARIRAFNYNLKHNILNSNLNLTSK